MRGFDLLRWIGLGGAALRPRPLRRALIYHGLDRQGGSGFNARFLGVDAFERQVAWLAAHARLVSLAEYAEGALDPERPTVCLTFDDGSASWLELALPVLERHRAPAAFFVTAIRALGEETLWPDRLDVLAHLHPHPVVVRGETFLPGRGGHRSQRDGVLLKTRCKQGDPACISDALRSFPPVSLPESLGPYWRLLDADGLRALAASPLVTVGSHGLRHLTLTRQTAPVLAEELGRSKAWLEETLRRPVDALAFPDGAWNPAVAEAALDAGYRVLLGSEPRDEPPVLGRLGINPFISWDNQVRCLYAGRY